MAGMAWAGNCLLLDRWDQASHSYGPIESYDLAGKRGEDLKLCGWLMGGDRDGKKLLVTTSRTAPTKTLTSEAYKDSMVAVVTPEGKVLREVAPGGDICDRDMPLISRHGNYVGAYCWNSPKRTPWSRRIDRMDGQETIYLPTGWGGAMAISETGGCLCDGCDSQKRTVLCFWTRDGKRHEVVKDPKAGTILDQEIFYIEATSEATTLRAAPLPQSGPGIAPRPAPAN